MKKTPMKRIYKLLTIDITKQVDQENELQFICGSKKELRKKYFEYFKGIFTPKIRSIQYFCLKNDQRKQMSVRLPK